jgi:hypothetical protein
MDRRPRMLVTGWPSNCGGRGMPQRAMTSSRSPSALLRTIGASWSGRSRGMIPLLTPRFDPPQAVAARFWRTRNQQLEYNPSNLFCPLV